MEKLYLYFSGVGNTKYVVNKFSSLYSQNDYKMLSIENKAADFKNEIINAKIIIIAYPIHDGFMPFIMSDFLQEYSEYFYNKDIIVIVTQMLFSGDGAALAYRILKKRNINLLASLHINMPNNITDVRFFPVKTVEESVKKVEKADKKIANLAQKIISGEKVRMGRRFYSRSLGFFGQRAYAKSYFLNSRKKVSINDDECIKCMKCINKCPVENLVLIDNKIIGKNICTLCYRCVNICPTQAINMLSKKYPLKQYIRDEWN
jgi:ferredoxin